MFTGFQDRIEILSRGDLPPEPAKKKKVITACKSPKTILEIMDILGYKDRRSAGRILNSLIERGIIAMTIPDKPKK